ncbi:CFEM domain-containing protein [Microdochium nivale]|nr:CFEM domain-containing protein [Microdochium nivale]
MRSALVILAVASTAAAQFFPNQPPCAIPCLSAGITQAGCQPTDVACQCGPKQAAIGAAAAGCLLGACNLVEVQQAQSAGNAVCSLFSAGSLTIPSATATPTGTGSSAAPSSGSASATATPSSSGSGSASAPAPTGSSASNSASASASNSASGSGSAASSTSAAAGTGSSSTRATTATVVTTNSQGVSTTATTTRSTTVPAGAAATARPMVGAGIIAGLIGAAAVL